MNNLQKYIWEKISVFAANKQGNPILAEMNLCGLLDVWDALFWEEGQPLWRNLWIRERLRIGKSLKCYIAHQDPSIVDLLTEEERAKAKDRIVKVLFEIFEELKSSSSSNESADIIEYLVLRSPEEFVSAVQLEEYLLTILEIYAYCVMGQEGCKLLFDSYFQKVRDLQSSIPTSWRRLSNITSAKVYWARYRQHKQGENNSFGRESHDVFVSILKEKGFLED